MVALVIGSCVAVLVSYIMFFRKESNNAMYEKVDVAIKVVENEIEDLKTIARVAALAMSNNYDLVDALLSKDRSRIVNTAINLQTKTSIDYIVLIGSDGKVLARTHELEKYGDDVINQPQVRTALDGKSESFIMQGPTIRLGVGAGTPIFDSNMNVLGGISLGFMLYSQDFVYNLKKRTGCEITVFFKDECIASTVMNEDGTYALGTQAAKEISDKVLAGETYTNKIKLFGKEVLAKYVPLYTTNEEIIGMMFV